MLKSISVIGFFNVSGIWFENEGRKKDKAFDWCFNFKKIV